MSTASQGSSPVASARAAGQLRLWRRPVAAIDDLLARPLASYQMVLGATGLLLGIGLLMVMSASSIYSWNHYGTFFHIFWRQLVFAVLGLVGFVIALRMPLARVRTLAFPSLIVCLLLIAATYTPLGLSVMGNRNWLPLFAGFNLQPSEFAKLAIVIVAAQIYTNRYRYLPAPKHVIMPMFPITATVAAAVIGQHDLGTALVLIAIIVGMLFVAGLPARFMVTVMSVIGVIVVALVTTSHNRMVRLFSFLDPWADPENAGHQVIKGFLALARGGFLGLGIGQSRQKWGALPEAYNDFILAVIGEELGLAGTLVILGLFAMLGYAGYRIATRSTDRFARYVAAGITIWLMVQTMINVGMVLGLLPVIGLPLPLISYGGSSLLVTLTALGLLANCARTEPGAAEALRAVGGRRS